MCGTVARGAVQIKASLLKQIGPIVDKQPVRRQLDGYEEEEYPDRSGPDLYRAMRGYPRMGSGDRCGLQLPDPGFALSRIRSTAVCYRSRNWECLEICAERWKTVVDLWPRDRVNNLNIEVQRSGVHDLIVLLRRLGTGVFLQAYFYRRRSIVKAGAGAGGV